MKSRQVSIVTPTARERFSTARPMLLLIAITVIALLGSVFLSQMGYNSEPVGIRNRHGDGARALAQVLGNHGVSVREVNADQAATVDDDTTLVVIFPSRMSDSVAKAIETRTNVVYVGLEEQYDSSSPYLGGLRARRDWESPRVVTAGCQSETATRAASLTSSAYTITGSAQGWVLCFSTTSDTYGYAEKIEDGRFRAIIPDSLRLRNRAITDEGNAALAINAIGRTPKVAWYSPTEKDTLGHGQDLGTEAPFLAPAFLLTIGACLIAAVARGRRLGPLTPENLPIEVPASETVIGKARLMRSQRAYEHAATALRSASASRIATAVGVAHTADRETLTRAIEQRGLLTSRSTALLWGPPPTSEKELVRLAHDLDALEKEIRQ